MAKKDVKDTNAYIVSVVQQHTKKLHIRAKSERQAIKQANEMYLNNEIQFTDNDVKKTTFSAELNPAIHLKPLTSPI